MIPSTLIKKNRKLRILFVSDSLNFYAGLSYVTANIMLKFLKSEDIISRNKKYDVAYATIAGEDSNIEKSIIHNEELGNFVNDIKVYNCRATDKDGYKKFNECIKEFKPDIVFSNHDPWHLDQIAFSEYRETYYWVCYSTVETPFYPTYVMFPTSSVPINRKSIKVILENADLIIPVTSVGTKVFKDMGLKNISEKHVYNGIDFNLRCTDNTLTKSQIFGQYVKDDDFIFMTMGVNSERKKIDVIIETFAKFLEKMNWNKKYKLYIHTDVQDRKGGTDLVTQINSLGLIEHVFAPSSFNDKKLMKKRDLYKRYKVSDCYIGLPAGEGYGYGNCEAMIHGKPVIYLDYGGPSCYLKDIGLPVKVKETFAARNVYMKWGLADQDDAVKQMCKIVSNDTLRKELGERSLKKAKEFDWDLIFKQLEFTILNEYERFNRSEIFDFNLKKII